MAQIASTFTNSLSTSADAGQSNDEGGARNPQEPVFHMAFRVPPSSLLFLVVSQGMVLTEMMSDHSPTPSSRLT
jgi:hypothetical protein